MKSKLLIQVRLRSGTTERTCLVDNADIRTGSWITLKNEDPGRRWEVIWMSHEINRADVHSDWHAGGL